MQNERRSRSPSPGAPLPRRSAPSTPAGSQTDQAKYPLPRATVAVLQRNSTPAQPCIGTNRSLALNKLVGPWATLGGTRASLDADKRGDQGQNRRRFLQALLQEPEAARGVREFMVARRRAQLQSYRRSGWTVYEFQAGPEWRFISGLGMANPLETNLVLHHIGGFPYIPGSSIKGAVRAYAELETGVTPRLPQSRAGDFTAQECDLLAVFGAQDQAGQVLFFDALPLCNVTLELDVINVHYPYYYQHDQPPADWQNPVPVLFLAVGKDTPFSFAVASRTARLAELALRWLQGAMQTSGLGGKTSAGYGFFRLLPASIQATCSKATTR
jgi:CRISPR-associated protein Cmr6